MQRPRRHEDLVRHDLSFALSTFCVLIVCKSARMQKHRKKQPPRKQMLQMKIWMQMTPPMRII